MFGIFNNKKKVGSATTAYNRVKFIVCSPSNYKNLELLQEIRGAVFGILSKHHSDVSPDDIRVHNEVIGGETLYEISVNVADLKGEQ